MRLEVHAEKCIGCAACVDACPHGAMKKAASLDRSVCTNCGECVHVCPSGALRMNGKTYTPKELIEEVKKDERYFRKSGGGLTVSGGEPLLWPEYVRELCRLSKEQGWHTAVDTSLYVPWTAVEPLLSYEPLFLADLKAADEQTHRKLTGQAAALIKENLIKLSEKEARFWISIPVVPEANTEELPHIAAFVKDLPHPPEKIRLLPYHALGSSKAKLYGLQEQQVFAVPKPEMMQKAKSVFSHLYSDILVC